MQWATKVLVAGLYPGAPCARKILAVELLNAVLEVWGPQTGTRSGTGRTGDGGGGDGGGSNGGKKGKQQQQQKEKPGGGGVVSAVSSLAVDYSFCCYRGFLGTHTVSLLLGGVVDSWDRCVPSGGWGYLWGE